MEPEGKKGNYGRLALMSALHFASMYVLMYAMVDSVDQVVANTNQLYMAGLMTAPMLLIEVTLMRGMYQNARYNAAILGLGTILLAGAFLAIRYQAAIDDRQFLRSMIPHHSGAILMCRESKLRNPDVQSLCSNIVESQKREIAQMEALLESP